MAFTPLPGSSTSTLLTVDPVDLDAPASTAHPASSSTGAERHDAQWRALGLLESPAHWPVRADQRALLLFLGQSLRHWPAWPPGVSVSIMAPAIPTEGLNDTDLPRSDIIVMARPEDHQIVLSLDVFKQRDQISLWLLRPGNDEAYAFECFDGPPGGLFSALAAGLSHLACLAPLIGAPELPLQDDGQALRSAWVDWLRHRSQPLPDALLRLSWADWSDSAAHIAAAASPPLDSASNADSPHKSVVATPEEVQSLIDALRDGQWSPLHQEIIPHVVVRILDSQHQEAFQLKVIANGRSRTYAGGTDPLRRLIVTIEADGSVEMRRGTGRKRVHCPHPRGSGHDAFLDALEPLHLSCNRQKSPLRGQVADVMSAHPEFVRLCLTLHRRHEGHADPDALVRQCWRDGQLTLEGRQAMDPTFVGKPMDAAAVKALLTADLSRLERREWLASRGYTLLNLVEDGLMDVQGPSAPDGRRPLAWQLQALRERWLRQDLATLLHIHLNRTLLSARLQLPANRVSQLASDPGWLRAELAASTHCRQSTLALPASASTGQDARPEQS